MYEQYVFNSRNQKDGETIKEYVTELRTLAQSCNFCTWLQDTLIRDRNVLRISDELARKRLLQHAKLTLQKCIDICRSSEATKTQIKAIGQDKRKPKEEEVHGLTSNRGPRNSRQMSQRKDQRKPNPCQ